MPETIDFSPPTSAASLSPVERAAIVLLSMGEEPASAVLRCLSRDELLDVTQVMSRLSGIKVDWVKTSLQEFFDDYREQSGVHGASRSYLKRSLDLALGGEIAGTVLNSIYGDAIRPKMQRLQWASPKWLAEQLSQEHPRMQAVFLTFLPSGLAGSVVEALPDADRDGVLLQMARLNEVDADLLEELDDMVERCIAGLGQQGATVEGVRQVAEILNRMPTQRQQMVELLRAHDPAIVGEIEATMYEFFMISRQSEATVLRLVEDVPMEIWAVALKGAEPVVRDAVLAVMPRRLAQNLEELMRRGGPMPMSRVEQARAEIMAKLKELADAGEIQVQLFAEATVE